GVVRERERQAMSAGAWGAREHHRFEAAGKPFVYLVPSAAIFELDAAADAVLQKLRSRPLTRAELLAEFREVPGAGPPGWEDPGAGAPGWDIDSTLDELVRVQAIGEVSAPPPPSPKIIPLSPFPLTTMVLNVTNQCNLSCTYCYEYGEDKIVDTENGRQPKF